MTKKKRPIGPAVLIQWADAAMGADPHWSDGERPPKPKRKGHNLCSTVGWLVHADKEWIQVVATVTHGQHAHLTEIPRGMVHSITILEVAGEWDGN